MSKFKTVDLFSGAGGLSVGFEKAGFAPVLAIDFDANSCDTYKKNFPEAQVIHGDISKLNIKRDVLSKISGNIDVVIGGPPCQGFSHLGKKLKSDPRNQLWRYFLKVIKLLNPKVWVMENVPELLKSQEFDEIKKTATELGYHLEAAVLNAANYGVPQKRRRVIILASRIGKLKHPQTTHVDRAEVNLFNNDKKEWISVKEAFQGLSLEPSGKNNHVGRNPTELSINRYKSVPAGGNRFDLPRELMPNCWRNKPTGSTDVFGRLWWDKPSLTIRTEFYKPEKGRYLHPSEDRPITLREGARLQTFPDDFEFVGSYSSIGRQIGNAVPCKLAEAIALEISDHLDSDHDSFQTPERHDIHYIT